MIAEKPVWVKHEGLQIFSIDVQPNGERFATGGGDHKVSNFSSLYLLALLGEFRIQNFAFRLCMFYNLLAAKNL